MLNKKYFKPLISLTTLLSIAGFSHAFFNDGLLQVNSTVENSCFFNANDVNFGEWNINIGETIKELKINVLCTKNTSYILQGEAKGGSYPHQNGTTKWQHVIQMRGTNPDNPDWLAYRIHNRDTLVLFNDTNGAVLGTGTGSYYAHYFNTYLFGNTASFPGRFISVTPDTYADRFQIIIVY